MQQAPKSNLHPRNLHRASYDLDALSQVHPALQKFLITTPDKRQSIDFSQPAAILALNTALLKKHYHLKYWKVPAGYLCPPVPGRADYLHYLADLITVDNKIPKGSKIKCLDIGTGASMIYPIIGSQAYGWSFVGTDTNQQALAAAGNLLQRNEILQSKIMLRCQKDPGKIFRGIIKRGERFTASICNPPFYTSEVQADAERLRKLRNIQGKKAHLADNNFTGVQDELLYKGGELAFIGQMIWESKFFANSVHWFTTLVAKEKHLKPLLKALDKAKARSHQIIEMEQGNKKSRILAWSFR